MRTLTFILTVVLLSTVGVLAQISETKAVASTEDKNTDSPRTKEKVLKDEKSISGKNSKTPASKILDKEPRLISASPKNAFPKNPVFEKIPVKKLSKLQEEDDEYHKAELYLGFSGALVIDDEFGFEGGGNVSGVYYFHRYIGAKVDFSATFQELGGGDHSLYNFTGGVQFKDSSKSKRIKPFGHVLAGYALHKDTNDAFPQFDQERNGLSLIFGGGLDIKVSDNIDIRAFQLDINPIIADNFLGNRFTYGNIRYGAGVVFNF